MPRAKFPRKNQLKAGRSVPAHTVKPEDVLQLSRAPDEVNRVNSARGGLHFPGNLMPTESGIHQVQAAPGFVWKPVTSIVDSGAINNVAPSSVSAKALVDSDGSLNGMTYHTADGTCIPNLGQKTLETVSEDGSTQLSQTFQIADTSRPLDFGRGVGGCREPCGVRQKGRLHREPGHGEATQFSERARSVLTQDLVARVSEWHLGFQSAGLRSFQRCSSPEVRSTERSEPTSPMGDAQDHQDMREDEEDLFGEEDFEDSEEAKELPNVIPICHKKPTVSEIVAHNRSHTPYRSWCKHCVAGRAPNLPHRPRRQDQVILMNEITAS